MKPTRSEKKLIAICALALAIPLGVAAFVGHINATPIVAATAPVKPPIPNGTDLYVQAYNAIKEAKPSVDANLDLKIPTDPKLRARRYSVARKDAWLVQNKVGFALFEKAQKAESLAPPYGANGSGKAMRQLARYKVIESNAHWQRGDFDAALQSGLDITQLAYDAQRGGNLMDTLVGTALVSLATRTTSDTIGHLSAPAAKRGARRIEKLLANRWTLDQALAEDKTRARRDWLDYFALPEWRTYFVRNCDWASTTWGTEPLTWKQRVLIRFTSEHQIISDLDIVYARAIADARVPYAMANETAIPTGNPFIDITYSYLARRNFSSARALVADRVTMLRLALRAHQLEHGAPPPNLQALVPNYINAVPADPFGKGEALRFQTDGKTYELWSIGPDGIDNGGTPIPWFKGRKNVKRHADERERLPFINDDSLGDYVAGRNH